MDTTTGPAVLGPLPVGADMLAGLTHQELDILHSHMGGGWPKQSAVHGQLNDLWWDTEGLLRDCHLARMALFEAEEYLADPAPAEVPETAQPAAPVVPDGVAAADPANPYGSYTDPAGKHGRYDAASAAEVAEGVDAERKQAELDDLESTLGPEIRSASPLAPPAPYRLPSIERSPNPDYVTEPYCKTCDVWVGLFPSTNGWHHFRGHPHSHRERFDAGHKPDIGWRRLDADIVPIGSDR